MKIWISIFLNLAVLSMSKGQQSSQLFFEGTKTINLPNLYENPTDSFILSVMRRTPSFAGYIGKNSWVHWALKESTFYLDLNGDGKTDFLFVNMGRAAGEYIDIYLDQEDEFKKVYQAPVGWFYKCYFSPLTIPFFYLSTGDFIYSSWPDLACYNEVTITKNEINQSKLTFLARQNFHQKSQWHSHLK